MAWLWGFMFQRNSFPLMRPSASSSSCCARFLVSLFCRSTLRFSCALFFELLWSSRYLDPRGVRVHFDQRISECNVLTLSHWVSLATQFAPCKRRHRRKNARGARGASGCSHRIHLTQHGQVVGYLALGSAVSAAIVGNHIEKCATRQWFFMVLSLWLHQRRVFGRRILSPTQRALMRSLAQLLQGRHGLSRLHWYHVKAHMGPRVAGMAQALLLSWTLLNENADRNI